MSSRKQTDTYLAQLDEFPPYLVSSLARSGRRAATQKELAAKLGWSVKKVAKFVNLKTWADVTVADADAFRAACGCSRKDERRQRFYIKQSLTHTINGFNHLRKKGRLPAFLKQPEAA